MDNGNKGELNIIVPNMNNLDPSINSFIIDMTVEGEVGLIYKFKVRTTNFNGDYTESNALSVALASLPSKPQVPPTSNPNITNM